MGYSTADSQIELPIGTGSDGVLVEEGLNFATGEKLTVFDLKLLDKRGDPARGVVGTGIGDKKVRWSRVGGQRGSLPMNSQLIDGMLHKEPTNGSLWRKPAPEANPPFYG